MPSHVGQSKGRTRADEIEQLVGVIAKARAVGLPFEATADAVQRLEELRDAELAEEADADADDAEVPIDPVASDGSSVAWCRGTIPAPIAATLPSCAASSCSKEMFSPSNLPPNTSCSIGDAMPITPMPADTLRHNTSQSSQNCRVRQAWPTVIDSAA